LGKDLMGDRNYTTGNAVVQPAEYIYDGKSQFAS
jgi:hypothetical protein